MDRKLKPGLLKPTWSESGLRKGFIRDEEAAGLYYPSEQIVVEGKKMVVLDTPMANFVTDDAGNEIVLRTAFRQVVEAESMPYADQYRAENNTLKAENQALHRQIAMWQSNLIQMPYMQPSNLSMPIMSAAIIGSTQEEKGLIYREPKNGEEEIICNFDIHVDVVIESWNHDKLTDEHVRFQVLIGTEIIELSVKKEKIDEVGRIISREVMGAIIYSGVVKGEAKVAEIFKRKLRNIPHEVHQKSPGWMTWEGKRIFAHDDHSMISDRLIMETGRRVIRIRYDQNSMIDILVKMLSMGPVEVMAPLVAVCLLGVMYELFFEANEAFAPRFVTFINGKSGSLKTAVSKVLFSLFDADKMKIPASFKDTPTAVEMRLKEYDSAVTLLDDFYSTGLKKERANMQTILEMVIRFVGDGIGKNRSNAQLADVKGKNPCGMVVVTGEDTAGQLSTLLRCVILNVDKDTFKGEVLEEFQNIPVLWSTFMAAFIEYLEKYYVYAINVIRSNYTKLRKLYAAEYEERRPADQTAQMQIAFEILKCFMMEEEPRRKEEIEVCIGECIRGCAYAIRKSQEYAKINSGENQYVFALAKLIFEKAILVAANKRDYIQNISVYDGFRDDNYYYLRSDAVYGKVRGYFQRQGRELSVSELNANRELDRLGLIITETENKGTSKEKKMYQVKVKIGKDRPRMLKMVIREFESYTS